MRQLSRNELHKHACRLQNQPRTTEVVKVFHGVHAQPRKGLNVRVAVVHRVDVFVHESQVADKENSKEKIMLHYTW